MRDVNVQYHVAGFAFDDIKILFSFFLIWWFIYKGFFFPDRVDIFVLRNQEISRVYDNLGFPFEAEHLWWREYFHFQIGI